MKDISWQLYIGGSLLMYFIIGIKIYLIDMWLGVSIRMFFYRLFHEEPLPQEKQFGFIHKKSGRIKVFWASMICAVTSLFFIFQMHTNPILEVVTYFFDTTFVFLGFLAGPWAWRTIKGKNKILEKLDEGHEKIVDGSLVEDVSEGFSKVKKTATSHIDEIAENFSGYRPFRTKGEVSVPDLTPSNPVEKTVEEPKETEEVEEDPREKIRKFTRRK